MPLAKLWMPSVLNPCSTGTPLDLRGLVLVGQEAHLRERLSLVLFTCGRSRRCRQRAEHDRLGIMPRPLVLKRLRARLRNAIICSRSMMVRAENSTVSNTVGQART
jgi:hypothetical protein